MSRNEQEEIDLDAIEAREKLATKGPWRWWDSNSHRRLSSDATGKDGDIAYGHTCHDGVTDIVILEEDMEFIEEARSDVPRLCAEVRKLRSRLAFFEKHFETGGMRELFEELGGEASTDPHLTVPENAAAKLRAIAPRLAVLDRYIAARLEHKAAGEFPDWSGKGWPRCQAANDELCEAEKALDNLVLEASK